ncbi:HAD hydrolase-like protein [Marinomonas sp. C2222]|uniref:HAD hydrolase-like protein n=1 Tax=Marinomonas sargassi TaxID=2984494 RepID=A0ABT2YTT8_9GAMM|nr:HAD hydrolase-like protein [Marinomonas sargassi]MCV2403296.1 HAD hydrolase-like protein [Marinomonas sargassi]
MEHSCLIFDLDGTISDPKEGIVKSLNYALSAHGFEQQNEDFLATFIGPPLDITFKQLTQSSDDALIFSLVAKYRERYSEVGFAENVLYEGVPDALERLLSAGFKLGVCTSKRVDFAERILSLFELRDCFQFINGGEIGVEKWQQLESLKQNNQIGGDALMIGDRYVDLTAAHKNGLASAGVLWGYGSPEELEEHEPAYLFASPNDLLKLIG